MTIDNVFIVGAGLMGNGIAQACAQAGISVYLNDISQAALEKALKNIEWSLGKLIEKKKLFENLDTILDRIQAVHDFSEAGKVDLALEAVFEKKALKEEIFRKLDDACNPDTLIASNTSAIPITELAAVTNRPEQVLGLHFFNPVPMMQAVEIVKAAGTSEAAMRKGVDFVRLLGKAPIRVESDMPGFLLNRIHLIGYVEAIRLLEKGAGTAADIDEGVKLAFGRRMGPFETGDMVGLDVSYGALMAIYEDSQDIRYYPPQLLRRKVKAGQLGRKTGSGWFVYNADGSRRED